MDQELKSVLLEHASDLEGRSNAGPSTIEAIVHLRALANLSRWIDAEALVDRIKTID